MGDVIELETDAGREIVTIKEVKVHDEMDEENEVEAIIVDDRASSPQQVVLVPSSSSQESEEDESDGSVRVSSPPSTTRFRNCARDSQRNFSATQFSTLEGNVLLNILEIATNVDLMAKMQCDILRAINGLTNQVSQLTRVVKHSCGSSKRKSSSQSVTDLTGPEEARKEISPIPPKEVANVAGEDKPKENGEENERGEKRKVDDSSRNENEGGEDKEASAEEGSRVKRGKSTTIEEQSEEEGGKTSKSRGKNDTPLKPKTPRNSAIPKKKSPSPNKVSPTKTSPKKTK